MIYLKDLWLISKIKSENNKIWFIIVIIILCKKINKKQENRFKTIVVVLSGIL